MIETTGARARKGLLERHVLVSLVRKSGQSRFTHVQRLSVCATMFALMMVTNAMWYESEKRSKANFVLFTLGPYSFTWHQLYVSTVSILSVYPPTILIAEVFRRTRRKPRAKQGSSGKRSSQYTFTDKKKRGLQFPHWVLIPAWLLVFLSIAGSSFFCILYSIQWGPTKSAEWLASVVMSFLEAILLVDPLMVSPTVPLIADWNV